jgi:hypothetical protein
MPTHVKQSHDPALFPLKQGAPASDTLLGAPGTRNPALEGGTRNRSTRLPVTKQKFMGDPR